MEEKQVSPNEDARRIQNTPQHVNRGDMVGERMWSRWVRVAVAATVLLWLFRFNVSSMLARRFESSGPFSDDDGVSRGLLSDSHQQQEQTPLSQEINSEEWKVPLDVHIMSKCPDALTCLHDLIVPTMERLSPKISFNLSYIGAPSPSNPLEIVCKHGPTECLGNILELCAASLYPSPKLYLGFTLCLSERYEDIPARELVQSCAAEHGIDFGKLNECASREDGEWGMGLLRRSCEYSRSVGVGISCTVRLDGKTRCVRDGGEWMDCPGGSEVADLTRDVENLWEERNAK